MSGEAIVKRAVKLMESGQARGWSHALKLAADEAKAQPQQAAPQTRNER